MEYTKPANAEENETSARDCETVCICNVKMEPAAELRALGILPARDPWAACDCPYCQAVGA